MSGLERTLQKMFRTVALVNVRHVAVRLPVRKVRPGFGAEDQPGV
jgi:hypothetical protein